MADHPGSEPSEGTADEEERGVDQRVEGPFDRPLVHQLSRESEDEGSRGSTEDRHGAHSKEPRGEPVDDPNPVPPRRVQDLIENV